LFFNILREPLEHIGHAGGTLADGGGLKLGSGWMVVGSALAQALHKVVGIGVHFIQPNFALGLKSIYEVKIQ
jgi:hypothetical protein